MNQEQELTIKNDEGKEKKGFFLNAVHSTGKGLEKIKDTAEKTKSAVFNSIDQNGDGEIGIDDVILMGLKMPGININREAFLRKELNNKYTKEIVEEAIKSNPMRAGIQLSDIDKIADEVIKYERNCVSGISAALGTPGGVAMVATIPADITQYYGYMLRAIQKMLYLYGFPEVNLNQKEQNIDTETMNMIILCMGVMYGVAGANNAVKAVAKALAKGVEQQLLKQALTKGTIYPIVKSISKWFGVKMTKQVFAGFFKKAIPLVGGVIGGGITFLTFKPCCDNLKNLLRDTMLSNPNCQDMTIDVECEIVE